MGRVVVLGASLSDMNLRLDRLPRPGETRLGSGFFRAFGGKGANQAVAAARAGAEVVFLSGFGDDDAGRGMLDQYRGEGLNLDHARVEPGAASGVALIMVGDDGENLIGVAMGPNAHLDVAYIDALPAPVFAGPGVFLASLEVPFEAVVRAIERAQAGGLTVVLNPAPAPAALAGHPVLRRVDVLTPNQSEGAILAELAADDPEPAAVADALLARGVKGLALTLGSAGCLVADAQGRDGRPGVPGRGGRHRRRGGRLQRHARRRARRGDAAPRGGAAGQCGRVDRRHSPGGAGGVADRGRDRPRPGADPGINVQASGPRGRKIGYAALGW